MDRDLDTGVWSPPYDLRRSLMSDAFPVPARVHAANAFAKGRDPRIDTAKGVLIVLVVLGHLLESIDSWQEGLARMPLVAIYLFHMPAFVFLAGVTTKRGSQWRHIATLLLLLACFQVVYLAVWSVIAPDGHRLWYRPFWLLWFLLAMVWWHALAPLILRAPRTAFAVSLIAALGIGAVPLGPFNGPLVLSRTLVFLPFFVAGCVWGTVLVERAATLSRLARIAWTVEVGGRRCTIDGLKQDVAHLLFHGAIVSGGSRRSAVSSRANPGCSRSWPASDEDSRASPVARTSL